MTFRYLALLVAAVALSGCSRFSLLDSCSRPREFSQLRYQVQKVAALPKVEVSSLGPQVHQALDDHLAKRFYPGYPYTIRDARRYESYILLTVSGSCMDCMQWLVYSPRRGCIVGGFVLYLQG